MGWPAKGFEPIETVFQREQQKARAAIIAKQAARKASMLKEREDSIAQAAKARAHEGQMVSLARGSALQALTVAVNLVGTARKLSDQLKNKINTLAELAPDDPKSLSPNAGLNMLQRIVDLQHKINSIAVTSMQMERYILGSRLTSLLM